jgi:hypothetical protein
MNVNQTQFINDQNKRNKHNFRSMELETEIPIWFNGRVKWISNLTSRSTCSDVIEAILSLALDSYSPQRNKNYILFESWRGVERTLKPRCRLLKLWNSWAGESENVILTLRSRDEETIPTHFIIHQQQNKLNKLKRQIKRTDKQIQKLNKLNENDQNICNYFQISQSIIQLNNQIQNQHQIILHLNKNIQKENENDFFKQDFNQLLSDVNQTLIYSRNLTLLADQLDQQINQINLNIDHKQTLLDELELDCALQENIDIDSLDDQDYQMSPSPPPSIPVKSLTGTCLLLD